MSTSREATINRIGLGNTGAGRYTYKNHTESDLELESEFVYSNDDDDLDDVDDLPAMSLKDVLSDDDLVEINRVVSSVARYSAGRKSEWGSSQVDAEAAAQEAMLKMLIQIAKGNDVASPGALAIRLAQIEVSNQTYGLGKRNRTAVRILNDRIEEKEGYLQRKLSPRERDIEAEKIYEHWSMEKGASRPSRKFQNNPLVPTLPMSSLVGNERDDANSIDSYHPNFAVDSAFDLDGGSDTESYWVGKVLDTARGEDEVDAKARRSSRGSSAGAKFSARKYAWNGVADLSGLPLVAEGSIANRQIRKVRAGMRTAPGGVAEAISQWRAGETTPATEALFAPFGETKDVERDLIAEKLMEHAYKLKNTDSYMSDVLWESAVSCADRRNQQ